MLSCTLALADLQGCGQALRDEEGAEETRQQLSLARKGHLRCLLHMGHHHSLLAQVDGWSLSCSGWPSSCICQTHRVASSCARLADLTAATISEHV